MDDKNMNSLPTEEVAPETNKPKRDWKKLILGGKGSKRGMYIAAVSAIVIALVVIVNLIVGQLPTSATEFDISGTRLYGVSSASQEFLAGLTDDIEIVILAQEGTADQRVVKFIYNYAAKSPHITVTEIDPVLHPSAKDTYESDDGNVVVINKTSGKQTVIPISGFDGYESAMLLYDYQYYYQYQQMKAVKFDADGQLTSAINIVTGESSGSIYTLSNHGESALASALTDRITKLNIASADLDLLMEGAIPDDCDLIVCNNPTSDMADEELALISTYLKDGGDMLLIVDSPDLKNFNSLLAKYGLQLQQGYVGDEARYYQAYASSFGYFCIAPNLSSSSDVTSGITSNAMLIYARGMLEITPERRGSSVEAIMTTSDSAVTVIDENTISDAQQYIVGAVCKEEFDDDSDGTADRTTRLTVISAATMTAEDILSSVSSIANTDIFISALSADMSAVSSIAVPSKSLNLTYNTFTGTALWGMLFIGVIPLALIVGGLVYWSRRRRR